MFTKFEWSPDDPRAADPKPGEPGHFDHHAWLKMFALTAYAELQASNKKIRELETKIKKLEAGS